jgi:hypothetical protein
MLSFMLFAGLFASTSQPSSLAEVIPLADLKEQATALGNRVRGRVLASFVKTGMTDEQVATILTGRKVVFGNWFSRQVWYREVGVTVTYETRRLEVAGEVVRSAWVVTDVELAPLIDLSAWLRPVSSPAP